MLLRDCLGTHPKMLHTFLELDKWCDRQATLSEAKQKREIKLAVNVRRANKDYIWSSWWNHGKSHRIDVTYLLDIGKQVPSQLQISTLPSRRQTSHPWPASQTTPTAHEHQVCSISPTNPHSRLFANVVTCKVPEL